MKEGFDDLTSCMHTLWKPRIHTLNARGIEQECSKSTDPWQEPTFCHPTDLYPNRATEPKCKLMLAKINKSAHKKWSWLLQYFSHKWLKLTPMTPDISNMQIRSMSPWLHSPAEEVNTIEWHPYQPARSGHRAMQSCYIHTRGYTHT